MNLVLTAQTISSALSPIHPCPPETAERLAVWTDVLNTWSRAQRLVGWRTREDLLSKGIADVWQARSVLDGADFDAMVDLGSGAGLPGLLLAADYPELRVHLVESRRKRASFLTEAARAMGLSQVRVHHGRSDDVRIALRDPDRKSDPDPDPDRESDPDPDRLLFVSRAYAAPSDALGEATAWNASLALVSTSLARANRDGHWPPEGWRQISGNFRSETGVDLHELLVNSTL